MPSQAELEGRVLHVDQHVVLIDKPPGIAVIPGRGELLADALRGQVQALLGGPLWVVHRIDRDTSGVVLFARDPDSHRELCAQFEAQRIRKTYWALAAGRLSESGHTSVALHTARKGKMRPAVPGEAGALPSRTDYRRLRLWPGEPPISELAVQPRSGRQHQIRVHLRALGAPLYGDVLYGQSTLSIRNPSPRLALHAWRLEFSHPQTGSMQCEAPLPTDLSAWLHAHSALR